MSNLLALTSAQLKRAANLKDKIGMLEKELASILGSSAAPATSPKKRGISAAGRAKIVAAQKARWAKVKKSSPVKKKSKISAAGRTKIAAAAKARWAKAKAAGKSKL